MYPESENLKLPSGDAPNSVYLPFANQTQQLNTYSQENFFYEV